MADTPNWAVANRRIALSGTITFTDRNQIVITDADITTYTINDSPSTGGICIGGVASASFSLELYNPGKAYTPRMFDNAEVHMRISLDGAEPQEFGIWWVDSADAPEQGTLIRLSGGDALKSRFNSEWSDGSTKSTTLGSYFRTICTAAGMTPSDRGFNFSDHSFSPALARFNDTGYTMREVLGHIAACAAGFVHVARDGKIEILCFDDLLPTRTLNPSQYRTFTLTGGEHFRFNCLQVKLTTRTEYDRYVIDKTLEDTASNCIQLADNPILSATGVDTSTLSNKIAALLAKVPEVEACSVTWGGDPSVLPGTIYTVTDLHGNEHRLMSLSQSYTYDGGLTCTESCVLPSSTDNAECYSTAGGVFDLKGNVRATRVSGLDQSIISATTAYLSRLTSDTITTDELTAAFIQATELRTQHIRTDDINTDSLTASIANIIDATIQKIQAGTIRTDELYTALAEITALKVGTLTADSISTDSLAAALASFQVLTAGTANFDKATIRHLISTLLTVEDATADRVFISNLAVDYANMVTAYVGNLCVRAQDGNYYRLNVDALGNVTSALVTVGQEEAEAGRTHSGQTILDTNIVASELTATGLKAVTALISRLDAARIDVQTLVAGTAFADYLRTADIGSNESIRFAISSFIGDNQQFYRQEDPPPVEGAEFRLWIQPSTGYIYQLTSIPLPDDLAVTVDDDLILSHTCPEGAGCDFTLTDGTLAVEYHGNTVLQYTLNSDNVLSVEAFEWKRVLDSDLEQVTQDMYQIHRYMSFTEDEGLIQRKPDSIYYTRVDENGFDVCSDREVDPIATMNAEEGFRARRLSLGTIICRPSGSGGWVWQTQ